VSNAIRQTGTVLGVSVGGAILGAHGGFESSTTFVDGLVAAHMVGASALALAAIIAFGIPHIRTHGHGHGPVDEEPMTDPAPVPAGTRR
jgi:hypothetical protein